MKAAADRLDAVDSRFEDASDPIVLSAVAGDTVVGVHFRPSTSRELGPRVQVLGYRLGVSVWGARCAGLAVRSCRRLPQRDWGQAGLNLPLPRARVPVLGSNLARSARGGSTSSRNRPVWLLGFLTITSGVLGHIPPMPASGPGSISQSAVLMTSGCVRSTAVPGRPGGGARPGAADVVEVQAGGQFVGCTASFPCRDGQARRPA